MYSFLRPFLHRLYYIGFILSAVLGYVIYNSSSNSYSSLQESFVLQSKMHSYAQINLLLQRSFSITNISLITRNYKLYNQGYDIFKLARQYSQRSDQSLKLSLEPLNTHFDDLDFRLQTAGEYIKAQSPLPASDLIAIAKLVEKLTLNLTKMQEAAGKTYTQSNNDVVRAQDKLNNYFKVFHFIFSLFLMLLMWMSVRHEKDEVKAQKNAYFEDFINTSLLECVVICDQDGNINSANIQSGHVLNCFPSDIVDHKITDILPMVLNEDEKFYKYEDSPIYKTIQLGDFFTEELLGVFLANGDVRWLQMSSQKMIEDPGNRNYSVIFTFSDKTDQYHTLKVVKQQQERIEASIKLSTLGEMAGGIAHEINNPLSIINAYAQELEYLANKEDSTLDIQTVKKISQNIEKTVMRVSKIVKGLKTYVRDGSHDPAVPTSIKSVVDDSLELCSRKIKKHKIKVEVDYKTEDIILECRSVQVSQVLINLVNNAADAISELSEKWIQIQLSDKGEALEISITDCGNGIPLALQEKLFQAFYTSKEVGKGTGLGLSISKGIIENHGGRLYIDNDNKNTRFVILLPRIQVQLAPKQAA